MHAKSLQSCPTLCDTMLLCPWDSPGKNTGVGCHALLQGIFVTQGLNPCLFCLLHWQAGSLPLVPPGTPSSFNISLIRLKPEEIFSLFHYSLLLYRFSVFPISFCMLTCMTQLSYPINKENDSLDTSDEFGWVIFCNSCLLARLVLQLCLTLCDPVDCSPPVSSVRGISQARRLEWAVMASFRGSSWPKD